MTILYFIIALGVLILVHEFGHFILARLSGIRVETFSIGFGPKILGFRRGDTDYKIAPIPLGGYIKMTGEDPDEAKSEDPRSFANKPVGTRMGVVAAGPTMNILLALVLMSVVFIIGHMEPAFLAEPPILIGVKKDSPAMTAGLQNGDVIRQINGKDAAKWSDVLNITLLSNGRTLKLSFDRAGTTMESDITVSQIPEFRGGYAGFEPMFFLGNEAMIESVFSGGPAEKAGVKSGDKVIAVDGVPIEGWIEMATGINEANGRPVILTVERNGFKIATKVTPTYDSGFRRWVLGIQKNTNEGIPMVNRKYGLLDSIKSGFKECWRLSGMTLDVLKKLFTSELSYKALGGPIQIAQASVAAAKYGLSEFLYFMAFLSIQLGILNLLPIPILDGGHVVFCAIEGLIKRPIPIKARAVAQYTGLAFILSIFLLVTINDIDSVWGIKNLMGKIFR